MRSPLRSPRGVSLGLCILFCLAILAGVTLDLYTSYHKEREHTALQLKNNNLLIAEWIKGAFAASDNVLRDIVSNVSTDELHYPPRSSVMYEYRAQWLADKRDTVPHAFLVGLFDHNCKLIFSPQRNSPLGFDAQSRDYCVLLRQNPDQASVVTPLFMSNFQRHVITQARRIGDTGQPLKGFATLGVDPGLFSQLLNKIELSPDDVVTILDSNLKIVARNPAVPQQLGRQTGDESLRALLANNNQPFVTSRVSTVDHKSRLVAFHKIDGLPFIVLIGKADRHWLAGWYTRLLVMLGAATILLIGAVLLTRHYWTQQELQACLEQAATTDPLTGVMNRRSWLEHAPLLLAQAHRAGNHTALMMIDIDHFKHINDEHGHAAGDRAIEAFARACGQELREIDLFCRFGGDEFVALLSKSTPETAALVAERIRTAVARLQIESPAGQPIPLTSSIGVVLIPPGQHALDSALARADQLLYKAKHQGRNCVLVDALSA
jgi:diguanylate cyclase (GGDEF)-like protein